MTVEEILEKVEEYLDKNKLFYDWDLYLMQDEMDFMGNTYSRRICIPLRTLTKQGFISKLNDIDLSRVTSVGVAIYQEI